jgi:hypothetical protein
MWLELQGAARALRPAPFTIRNILESKSAGQALVLDVG